MSEPTKPVEAKRSGLKWGIGIALLAIVGVVAAVGWIFYTEHSTRIARSQNSEAITLMKSVRTALSMHFQDHQKWPVKLDEAGAGSSVSGTYTESVRMTKGAGGTGEVELTTTMRTQGAHELVAGKTIRMVSSDGGKTWTCKRDTMPAEYVPYECRNN
jgi:hypothetical protein